MANEQKHSKQTEERRQPQKNAPAVTDGEKKGHTKRRSRRHGHGKSSSQNQAQINNLPRIVTETAIPVPEQPITENDVASEDILDTLDSLSAKKDTASEESESVEIVGVRFRTNTKVYYFDPSGKSFALGERVIVETSRGIEFGTVSIANRTICASDVVPPLKKVLRAATAEDIAHHESNRKAEAEAAVICEERVKKFGLDMKIVDVEYTFDNSKLLFYFTSEGRVDFRELVKNLASVFRTRIELRQIGIRDEAKMMGGLGSCGRPFCCSEFLPDFVQVSIKMAKEQNFSLNSAKISGSCGRLMCCLRYEHEAYEEAIKLSPKNGATVTTPDGVGTVVEVRPLAGTVKVRFEEKNEAPRLYSVSQVATVRPAKKSADSEETIEE